MKKITFLLALLSTCFLCALGQDYKDYKINKSPEPVRVVNWMKTGFLFPDGFWEVSTRNAQIIKQIGEVEFEKVKKYSHYSNIPVQMLLYNSQKTSKRDTLEYKQKQNSLNVFQIALYSHWWHGEYWGEYVILSVPYSANKDWDSTAKWDTVYFIIPGEYIEQITENKR